MFMCVKWGWCVINVSYGNWAIHSSAIYWLQVQATHDLLSIRLPLRVNSFPRFHPIECAAREREQSAIKLYITQGHKKKTKLQNRHGGSSHRPVLNINLQHHDTIFGCAKNQATRGWCSMKCFMKHEPKLGSCCLFCVVGCLPETLNCDIFSNEMHIERGRKIQFHSRSREREWQECTAFLWLRRCLCLELMLFYFIWCLLP